MKQELIIAFNYTIKAFVGICFILLSMIFFVSWGNEPHIDTTKTVENDTIQRIYKPTTFELDTEKFYYRYDVNKIAKNISLSHINNIYNTKTRNYIITSVIIKESLTQKIPINLAFAIAKVESDFNPIAINHNHDSIDYGLFQLNNSYRDWNRSDFFNIRKNTKEGVRYLKEMLDLFDGDVLKTIAAYNCGPQRVIDNKIPESTRMYITKVVAAEDEFNILFNNYIDDKSIVLNKQEVEWIN